LPDFIQEVMCLDAIAYLPDDILAKVDRASMGVSLESRIPLLDPRAVEFAWQIPQTMKVRNQQGKWILRQVLYQYVPQSLIERPKTGFDVPIGNWLREPLRDWAESLLYERRLQKEVFFQSPADSPKVERASSRQAKLAGRALGCPHVSGLARVSLKTDFGMPF
jgi:asparagine synthase (glutamine-hydrolysing)